MKKRAKPVRMADLKIRKAHFTDISQLQNLIKKVYPLMPTYKEGHLRGQINAYNDGVFVALYKNKVVGYCAAFLVSESEAFRDHTWTEITGAAYNSRHNRKGQWLYGMEVCVDPDMRGKRIGQRLYEARKRLVEEKRLKGIVIVGRMPNYHKNIKKYPTPKSYLTAVRNQKVRDPVIGFQIRNGFKVKRILKNYLTTDIESQGNAVMMIWHNPAIEVRSINQEEGGVEQVKTSVRVTSVQYMQRRVRSFDEFIQIVEYFVDVAADYKSDFVVFPEWFTLQLLSMEKKTLEPKESLFRLAEYTERFTKTMRKFSIEYNIHIIGGSTAVIDPKTKAITNVSFVFLRDGSVYSQSKIHPTPNESYWWDLQGGNEVQAIPTDCGTIGVLICYDSEFPELTRHLVDQGMKILFVPFCTDERQSYLRVRYCCQARAVENQIYVVMSGNCGNLPRVENMDIQYAQSCILTPCDLTFSRDGIAADTTPNVETVAVADLHLDSLVEARNTGTVQPLKNRRHDLYHLVWKS